MVPQCYLNVELWPLLAKNFNPVTFRYVDVDILIIHLYYIELINFESYFLINIFSKTTAESAAERQRE